jgi:hypothetical protein
LALAGLAASLAVHAAALAGIDAGEALPGVWLLHLGAVAVSLLLLVRHRTRLRTRRLLLDQLRGGSFPPWSVRLGAVLFIYALLNFALFAARTDGGNPDVREGRFVLLDHGRLVRELTREEYRAYRANELRGFSGHWVMFYYLPAAFGLFRRRPSPPMDPQGPRRVEPGW